ncbi:MAG: hypothetical protein QOC99_3856 [Acidobacteriota bacterium]|jgi:hypothetical protein|nr:hypothetical protein [Acidobacteriota bacterium]
MTNGSSHGGRVTAVRLRQKALSNYYESPNLCKRCGAVIMVPENMKVTQVRKKTYCNRSCSVGYNNHVFPKRKRTWEERPLKTHNCLNCNGEINSRDGRRKYCEACKAIVRHQAIEYLDGRTKGDLFTKSVNWQAARSSLRGHAFKAFLRSKMPRRCVVCHYFIHVEIAHIRPVKHFPNDALVSDINDISNLVALCPNHHWEFDHGLLDLARVVIE